MQEISIIALVIGLTQWVKTRLNVEGQAAEIVSLLTGIVLGIGAKLALGLPTDYAGWFGVVIYGLAMGLVPSGLYKFASEFKPSQS